MQVMRDDREAIAVTTVVHIHNLLGRIYMAVITPMHRMIVPASLARLNEPCHHG